MDTEKKHQKVFDNFARNGIPIDHRYQYVIPENKHIPLIAQMFTKSFCTSEPMTQYLAMDQKKYLQFATNVAENAVADGLSIIALDQDKVVACALVEDFAAMHEINSQFDPNFRYILALLEQLGEDFFKDKQFQKNYIAHLFITAVDEKYRRQGLSTQINFRAMNLVASKGFEFVYCELTNIYNEYGIVHHLKNQPRLIGACTYQDFHVDDLQPFKNLPGGARSYLWEINQATHLNYILHGNKISEKI